MALKFSATRLKKSILPYISFLAEIKMQDLCLRQNWQYMTFLEDAVKKNVVPTVMEITKPSSFNEARDMFSKIISEAATANITDEEVLELHKSCVKQTIRMDILSTKIEELDDQFTRKFNKTALPQLWPPSCMDMDLACQETIEREMNEYNRMYESLIKELPGLNISNASDASVDFVITRIFKLDEAIIRRVLDEWVAFKRDLHLAMEKFDFTLYLLDNKPDLVFKGDYEGLANVVRSGEEMLAKNHREEAVSELLENWKCYKPQGALKKNVKSFKEEIQQEKEHKYERRMRTWKIEAYLKKFYLPSKKMKPNVREAFNEVLNEDPSLRAIHEGLQTMDNNASPTATPEGVQIIFVP